MNEPTSFEFDRTCARLASALTAYFDGEATPAEAKTAREHLRHCAECAELWQAWTNSRSLLLSAPVPAPPPGFLLRLLTVCRLAALRQSPLFSRVNAARDEIADTHVAPEKVASLLGLVEFDNYRAKSPKAAREAEPQPPAFLLDAIRQATTRADEFESHAVIRHETDFFESEGSVARTSWWRGMPRVAASYAVPALLALMMWSGTSENEAITVELTPVTSSIERSEDVSNEAPVAATRRARPAMVRPAAATPVSRRVSSAPQQPRLTERTSFVARELAAARVSFANAPVASADSDIRGANLARAPRVNRVPAPRRSQENAVSSTLKTSDLISLAMVMSQEAPRREVQTSLRRAVRSTRRSTPRLLTPVSFAPVAVRSHASSARWERPVRVERASEAPEETEESNDSWGDDNDSTASVVESYRAAVAEDSDETEATS
ncbi:MAG TPA: zf-HC2 domain-containing protein [Abditibacteriaceae bacterium]|jgi:anti-sigma factor RsiW